MLRLILLFLCVAGPLAAGDIPLDSHISHVTVYPRGATVERTVTFDMPAGQHRLIIADLPLSTPLETIRADVAGASLRNISTRNNYVLPRDPQKSEAITAAEKKVETLEAQLREAEAAAERIRFRARAAEAQIKYLGSLGKNGDKGQVTSDEINAILSVIGSQTEALLDTAQSANIEADNANRALKDLREEVRQAQQALEALLTEESTRAMIALDVDAPEAGKGTVTLRYQLDMATWRPVYDIRLDRENSKVEIDRGAFVSQNSGEDWNDVTLSLSTRQPLEQMAPSEIRPDIRQITDPISPVMANEQMAGADVAQPGRVAAFAKVFRPEMASPEFEAGGLSVTYNPPDPVTIANGADHVRIALAPIETDAEIRAIGAPLSDNHAFLTAEITNTSQELLLATNEANFFVGHRFAGKNPLPLVPAGDKATLSFGAIDGLTLSRKIVQANEGDEGILRKSNHLSETILIEAKNLTNQDWPLRIIDRVPASRQEDLIIDWSSTPQPTRQDIVGKPGVLEWDQVLKAGATQEIHLEYSLHWPEDKVLQ